MGHSVELQLTKQWNFAMDHGVYCFSYW